MKKDVLDEYVGKIVTLTFFNKRKAKGRLYKTDSNRYKNEPSIYLSLNCYILEDVLNEKCYSFKFKCSHVVWLKEGE